MFRVVEDSNICLSAARDAGGDGAATSENGDTQACFDSCSVPGRNQPQALVKASALSVLTPNPASVSFGVQKLLPRNQFTRCWSHQMEFAGFQQVTATLRPQIVVETADPLRPFVAVLEKQGLCEFHIRPAADGTPYLYASPTAESRAQVCQRC